MSSKRLYQITDVRTRKPIPDLYFNNKMEAKEKRRSLNPTDEKGNEILNYVVSPGPDHMHHSHKG